MANYLVNGSTMTGIANAIRSKTGSQAQMTASEMASAISGISTGHEITLNGQQLSQDVDLVGNVTTFFPSSLGNGISYILKVPRGGIGDFFIKVTLIPNFGSNNEDIVLIEKSIDEGTRSYAPTRQLFYFDPMYLGALSGSDFNDFETALNSGNVIAYYSRPFSSINFLWITDFPAKLYRYDTYAGAVTSFDFSNVDSDIDSLVGIANISPLADKVYVLTYTIGDTTTIDVYECEMDTTGASPVTMRKVVSVPAGESEFSDITTRSIAIKPNSSNTTEVWDIFIGGRNSSGSRIVVKCAEQHFDPDEQTGTWTYTTLLDVSNISNAMSNGYDLYVPFNNLNRLCIADLNGYWYSVYNTGYISSLPSSTYCDADLFYIGSMIADFSNVYGGGDYFYKHGSAGTTIYRSAPKGPSSGNLTTPTSPNNPHMIFTLG